MNIFQLTKDIYSGDKEKQYNAARLMGAMKGDQEAIGILYDACYEADDPRLQQEAVRSLGKLVGRQAMERFIKTTYNTDFNKRMRAYFHLGTLGNREALKEVLKGFADENPKVRRAAVYSAGRLGSSYQTIAMLKKLLNGYEEQSVEQAAKVAISMIQNKINKPQGPATTVKKSFNSSATKTVNRNGGTKGFNSAPNKRVETYSPKGF